MMISPEGYINRIKDKSYSELLVERDELLAEIREFENNKEEPSLPEFQILPSPETRYQMNLLYLSELCKLIEEKYSEERYPDDEEE